jgi:hypothetical protein
VADFCLARANSAKFGVLSGKVEFGTRNEQRINMCVMSPVHIYAHLVQQEISLTAFNSGTSQTLPFGVSTTIQQENITAASETTSIFLVETLPVRYHYCRM